MVSGLLRRDLAVLGLFVFVLLCSGLFMTVLPVSGFFWLIWACSGLLWYDDDIMIRWRPHNAIKMITVTRYEWATRASNLEPLKSSTQVRNWPDYNWHSTSYCTDVPTATCMGTPFSPNTTEASIWSAYTTVAGPLLPTLMYCFIGHATNRTFETLKLGLLSKRQWQSWELKTHCFSM